MVEARRPKTPLNRLKIILIFLYVIVGIIILKLFWLQVIRQGYYQNIATKEHFGYSELPARRGEILIKDYNSNELYRLATNTTLDLIFADPTLVKNPEIITETLAPLLFDLREARERDNARIEEEKKKLEPILTEIEQQQKELEEKKRLEAEAQEKAKATTNPLAPVSTTATGTSTTPTATTAQPAPTTLTQLNEEQAKLLKPLTDEELKESFRTEMLNKLTSKKRTQIILGTDIEETVVEDLKLKNIPGIEAQNGTVTIFPLDMSNRSHALTTLSDSLKIPVSQIEKIINTKNRYVILKRKTPPQASEKIKEILKNDTEENFSGINIQSEYYRFYPEKTLAANIIGYVNSLGVGLYGIESKFNVQLQGIKGIFQTQKDSIGRQITVGESTIQPAVDGDDIVLTIDRSIQMKLDKLMERGVKENNADDGLGIVYDPQTGKILAMSHYPTFDPNAYGKIFEKETVNLKPEEVARLVPVDEKTGHYTMITDLLTGVKINIFKEVYKNGTINYKKYKNTVGAEAYQNKSVAWPYEPGSVFKPLVVAAAIDDHDITANTQYNDNGPIKTDEYTIKNALEKYYGTITMTQVLEKSLNTGMAFIARKIGRNLLYNYMTKYGFGVRTDIEFADEATGKIEHFTQWAESELITHAFGQGITVTPIQMVMAYGSLANKGTLMQPYIVDEIRQPNGKVIRNEPHAIRQVTSEETANEVTKMLISAVERGVATHAAVPNHYVAGKTGTAQTYYKGKPLSGSGTTIATVMGYGPVDTPRFVILIKLTRPRKSEWADATAAPIFSQISQFLFDYYNIPPDKRYTPIPPQTPAVGVDN